MPEIYIKRQAPEEVAHYSDWSFLFFSLDYIYSNLKGVMTTGVMIILTWRTLDEKHMPLPA
jgi:hypothetical protein